MERLTLFLVDDEPIILKGLLETYDWERMGFEVAGSARDGEEALEKIKNNPPDVVLTDVRMKKMDGLALIEQAKELGLPTNFMVISAYRDFEYAKKACQNGALSYLVKPIDDDELERTMAEIYELCTDKKFKEKNYSLWEKIIQEDQENFLQQMMEKYLDDALSENELEEFFVSLSREALLEHYYAVIIAGIDIARRVVNQKEFDMKQYVLETRLYKNIQEKYPVWRKKTSEGAACYIVDLGDEGRTELLKRILTVLRSELREDMISVLSNSEKGLAGLRNGYVQAVHLFEMAAEAGAGVLTMEGKTALKTKRRYSIDVETQLLGVIRKNDGEQLKKTFEKFIYTLPEEEEAALVYLRRLAVRVEFALEEASGLTEEMKRSFQNFYDAVGQVTAPKAVNILYQLFVHVIELREDIQETSSEKYFRDYIPVALEYIQEHLHEEDLSITGVSEHVYLNSVYFGRIFKNVMNMSFKRYVQNMRMEKAKEMIQEGRESIVNISSAVGIPNPSYFAQLFKQYTGVNPSEYKRSLES